MARIDFTTPPGQYEYNQTALGKSAHGVVQNGATSERNPGAQRAAGGEDRQPGDHGGHLIPHSMGGRNDETNLDAQSANVNQIGQRGVERQAAQLANDPNKAVFMDVQNYNSPGSQRPDATMITVAVEDKNTGQIDVQHHSMQNASYAEQAQWEAIANQNVEIDPRQDIGMTAEERELANSLAEEEYEEGPLGSGFAVFFDPDTAPISSYSGNSVNDGVSLGSSAVTADVGQDDGVSLGDGGMSAGTGSSMDDGMSLGGSSDDGMDGGDDDGMDGGDDGMSND